MKKYKENIIRVNMSMRPESLEKLDVLAELWGLSRSSMVTTLVNLRLDQEKIEHEYKIDALIENYERKKPKN